MLGHFAVVCKNKRKVRHVKAESSHSDYSNESSETEDSEEEFYVGSIVIDNSTTDISNVTQEYIVEQSNTNSEDQQDTDKSIDESIVDVKSDNKEEKLYDEPELMYKEDKQEEKAEVNQYEHITARVNAGDNQTEMAPKGDHSKDTAEEAEELFISAIENEGETESDFSRSQWQLPLKTCGMYVTYTLDTGAQANILPQRIYYSLENRPRLHKTNIKLSAYNGESVPAKGKVVVRIEKGKNKSFPVQFIVVPTKSNPIIGHKTCERLNLIKRVMLINDSDPSIFDEYDIFGELGCLPGEYHINTDETVKPVVHPPRRVPFALRHKLKAELEQLVSLNVIEKVDHPTDWVNSIVLVEKSDGSIRICLDPKDLNKAIKCEFTQLPTPEEIMSMMAGATRFSKIDASSGYWQITLDKESSNLLAFSTPFGRYKFMRLLFGVHCTSEVFDKRIVEIIDGLPGCAHIQDDILVWGKDKEDHDQNLRAVMDRIQKSGLN